MSHKIKSPFDIEAQKDARTCVFFSYVEVKEHLDVLKQGSIGKALVEFREKEKIEIVKETLPNDTEGLYVYAMGSAEKGIIKHGYRVNALLLGHEIHHARQHLRLATELQYPSSASARVLLDRFHEADGRAIEFGVTLQTFGIMGAGNKYASNLLACLDDYQKDILEHSMKKTEEICSSPPLLKQAMRQVFDRWIALSPIAPAAYREGTEAALKISSSSRLLKKFFDISNGGRQMKPCLTSEKMDPAYPQKLAEALGNLCEGLGGNYLTETKGPAFNSPFYTRISDFRLEHEIATVNAKIKPR